MKKILVQVLNPMTKRYTIIDKTTGTIVGHTKDSKPAKNVPIVGGKREL